MKLEKLIERAYDTQEQYAQGLGPECCDAQTRYQKVIEMMGHMQEEIIEARQYVPRRDWRTAEKSFMDDERTWNEYVEELADVMLFLLATVAWSNISPEQFCNALREKRLKNVKRVDHVRDRE